MRKECLYLCALSFLFAGCGSSSDSSIEPCKSGEIFAKWGDGEEACHSCQDLIQRENECTEEACKEIIDKCRKQSSETPTDTPTDKPTDTPTDTPTDKPTDTPTDTPTDKPTDTPTDKPTDTPTDKPTDTPTDTPTDKPTDTPTDTTKESLTPDAPEITIYQDLPRILGITYKREGKVISDAELEIIEGKDNDCAEISSDSMKTDSDGRVRLVLKSKENQDSACAAGIPVKVCRKASKDEGELCAEIKVRTTSDGDMDKNGNFMYDDLEINADKDNAKFGEYEAGNCATFCRSDNDCPTTGFCDSAIGSRCSTRCDSDEQCISYKESNDGPWIGMICRKDGRCAYPSFKYQYKISKDNAEVVLGGRPVGGNENCTIDWGDGSKIQKIPGTTDNDLKHQYKKSDKSYTVTITGEYEDWRADCSEKRGIDITDVLQFGPVGIGYKGDHDKVDVGSFTNCMKFNKMSAKDIPDASKLKNMSSMFAGNETMSNGSIAYTTFNQAALSRWDTRNVTEMFHTFMNSGDGDAKKAGFNQNIERWDVSNVTTMKGMFLGAISFNGNIGCWNPKNAKDIGWMFFEAVKFNQNLGSWDLSSTQSNACMFRAENGHNGDISLKNYCALRDRVPEGQKDIGREGPKNSCVGYGEKARTSTCCGISGMKGVMNLCNDDNGNGIEYGDSCAAAPDSSLYWKRIVDRCKDEYLQYQTCFNCGQTSEDLSTLTEDTMTCHHLRICRDCYNRCHNCLDECRESYKDKTGKECEDYCSDKKVLFDEYGTTGGGSTKVWCSCRGLGDTKRYWER